MERILADCKQKVDFLAAQKVKALEELLRRAKAIKTRKLADKIKGKL
jgi:hypothetical protein